MPTAAPIRTPELSTRKRRRGLAAVAASTLAVALVMVASPAIAEDGPYNINGVVPDAGTTEITDEFGNVKELGPLNSNTTKIGVIHDDVVPTLGDTNPNAQVDLRRAWLDTAKDTTTGDDWLYFAWERDKNTGSGFIAYEFMQSPVPDACAYETATDDELIAGCNPWENRQDEDFMILWDQQGGSLDLYLRVWDDSSGTLLLGAPEPLDDDVSQAAYSTDGFRGEAAVNLTATIFGDATGCITFANTIPSTVTGNSDTADYKDTILAPTPPISNCGSVTIRKETVPDEDPNETLFGFDRSFTVESDAEPPDLEFDLTDDDAESWDDVPFGTDYVVDESTIPTGWALQSIDCSASTGYGTEQETEDAFVVDLEAGTVTFDLGSGQTVDCTYTNAVQTGSLLIVKERKHVADNDDDPLTVDETHPHAGVDFTVSGGNLPEEEPLTGTTNADGELCFDGLVISSIAGDYTVTETVPEGYVSDDSEKDVTIVVGPDCADEDEDPVTVNFLNTPLTDLSVSVTSQVPGGTISSIECDATVETPDDAAPDVSLDAEDDSPSVTIEDLLPGEYTCVVVIDP
jgi:hypothetical protein